MKGSKSKIDRKFWDVVFGKLKRLGTAIEMYYGGDMDIDNMEYRWVDDRIKHYEKNDRLLTKQEMDIANLYWRKYNV
jgi:hypothetical protein